MTDRIEPLDPPVRALRAYYSSVGVNCKSCGEEIEATARIYRHGMDAGHQWRHVESQSTTCTRTYEACPYDGFAADHRIEEAQRAAWDDLSESEELLYVEDGGLE